MKRVLVTLLVPCWLGCGVVVDLGQVESTAPIDVEVTEFEPWEWGMCARSSDDSIWCWREGDRVAKKIALTGAAITSDFRRLCAVQPSGRVHCTDLVCAEEPANCWSSTPVYEVAGIEAAVDFSIDGSRGVALRADGRIQLWCEEWSACYGPDGLGLPMAVAQQNGRSIVGEPFALDEPIVKLATRGPIGFVTAEGSAFTVLVQPDSTTIIPNDPSYQGRIWPPVRIPGIDDAVAMVGNNYPFGGPSFVLRGSGKILAFGWTPELGIGRDEQTRGAGEVVTIDDAIAAETSGPGSCAIRADRSLWCWGWSSTGSLGVMGPPVWDVWPSDVFLSPVGVSSVDEVRAVGLHHSFTCIVNSANEVLCLGSGSGGPSTTPYRVEFR